MKVRLPTKLFVLRNFQYMGFNVILALDTDGEEVIIPSVIKDTKGHGNAVTHSKPIDYDAFITWDDNRWWRQDMPNLLNGFIEGYEGQMPIDGKTRKDHRGSRVLRRYDYRDPRGHIEYGFCRMTWYCLSHPTPTTEYKFRVSLSVDKYVESNSRIEKNGWKYHRDRIVQYDFYVYETGWPPDVQWYNAGELNGSWDFSQKPYGQATGHFDRDSVLPASYYFWFNEPGVIWEGMPRSSFQERIMTAAFTKAFEQVPQYADNNIANMIEIGGLCKDILTANPEALDKWGKLTKKYAKQTAKAIASSNRLRGKFLRDAWMTYRYAYCTTSSDVKQAIDTAARRTVTYLKPLRFDGTVTLPNPYEEGGEVTCHVQFDIRINAKDALRDLHHYLQMYGVSPSLYKAWDLVPFSFVADWFFDIGGVLERWEREESINDYRFDNFWWSMKYTSRKGGRASYKCYARWSEYFIPDKLAKDYNSSSSTKTWLKRVADGYCLVHK
jgi:hypothetical protein